MYSQDHNQGPRFIWTVGFLALGTLSAIGAAALFPWYLAIAIAVLVVGLASACAYQFRVTNNPLYLVAMCLMTALASFLDGVSVWELLNETQNSGLHAASANEGALEGQLKSTQQQADALRAQIATVVEEYTNMDNDGNTANDKLVAGKIALAESLKADLANVQARVDELQAKTITAASTTAVTDAERHILLQMADEHPHPARWLMMWASVVFLIPEFTLALLAWSMHGGERREERKDESSVQAGLPAGALLASHLTPQHAQWLLQQHQLHAVHSLAHAFPGMSPLPNPSAPAGEHQSTEWSQPSTGGHLAVAGRTSSTTTTTQQATEFASQPVAPSQVASKSTEVSREVTADSVAQPSLSPLAIVGSHPGLIHHAHPEGVQLVADSLDPDSSDSVSGEELVTSPGAISTLREAKKRKHNFFGSSATKAHKQKGRKARNLSELAARLN
jgi:hypothetical protein